MLTVFFRTIIIYVLLVIIMRIMGKRQLGELELSELITTFLLSEIAALPIIDRNVPIIHAVIPIATLAALEIGMSILLLKFPRLKQILSSPPAMLISQGKINKKEMTKARISIDELVTQLRQNGIYGLEDVDYAILEENGKMSIIPKSASRQPDAKALGISYTDSGVMHILVSDGRINTHSLRLLGKDEAWLSRKLKKYGVKAKDIFCMTMDDAGRIFIQKTDGSQIKPSK